MLDLLYGIFSQHQARGDYIENYNNQNCLSSSSHDGVVEPKISNSAAFTLVIFVPKNMYIVWFVSSKIDLTRCIDLSSLCELSEDKFDSNKSYIKIL